MNFLVLFGMTAEKKSKGVFATREEADACVAEVRRWSSATFDLDYVDVEPKHGEARRLHLEHPIEALTDPTITILPCEPKAVGFHPGPFPLVDRFGRSEIENAAAMVVRWHHVNSPDAWVGVSRSQMAHFTLRDDLVREWFKNPFFGIRPDQLEERGFFLGWAGDVESPGMFTQRGIECLMQPRAWHRGASEQ